MRIIVQIPANTVPLAFVGREREWLEYIEVSYEDAHHRQPRHVEVDSIEVDRERGTINIEFS